ncbi:hypothetical protein [Fundidesulfovibrio terrae]|uniref:hypothetical protein n=1 Tax=Fundidesulfovibrio terrae TaxID=2922866 RepID=UPI001FB000F2|nr:hypothetical protein [Fundidesulfovibrio terrae]
MAGAAEFSKFRSDVPEGWTAKEEAKMTSQRQSPRSSAHGGRGIWLFFIFALLSLPLAGGVWAKQQAQEVRLPPGMEAKASAVCGMTDVYDCYTNHKYGYLLAWPKKLLAAQGESDAGDGQVFNAPGGRAQLTCWAGFNSVLKQSLKKVFQEAQQEPGLQVTYKSLGNDFFVVSGLKDGKILYRKTVMTDLVQTTFVLTYDQALKDEFDPLVGNIAKSFIAHPAFM